MSAILGRKNISRVRKLAKRGRLPSMNVLRLAADVADTETVTINGTVFEFTTDGTVTSGRVAVDVAAAQTPTAASTALVTAINASSCGMLAKKISNAEVLVWAANGASTAFACTETLAGSNNAWAAATAFGGRQEQSELPVPIMVSRVPTATEIALQTMHFPLNFTPTVVFAQVRTSAGAHVAFDGTITITDDYVSLTAGGSVDPASGDVVTLLAY
jgi:hypothetical protein